MIQTIAPQLCPECGHHSGGIVAGKCTSFVVTPGGPRHADYCGHSCYDTITGRSWEADWAAAMAPPSLRKPDRCTSCWFDECDGCSGGDCPCHHFRDEETDG